MREILFRGQIRKKGEKVNMAGQPIPGRWIYGGICHLDDYSKDYVSFYDFGKTVFLTHVEAEEALRKREAVSICNPKN